MHTFFVLGHASEGVVLALEITRHGSQSGGHELLDQTALLAIGGRRQGDLIKWI